MDNTILKVKAFLVGMGFSQVKGVDYMEVFAPTPPLETLHLVLLLIACKKWTGCQVDIKTGFLKEHLDEPVYTELPAGYEETEYPNRV